MQINPDEKKAQESLMSEIRSIANELESKPAPEILNGIKSRRRDPKMGI